MARANFNTLVCYIVPLSGWWRELIKDDSQFKKTFDELTDHAEKPRGKYAELGRYVALVGFIDYLMRPARKRPSTRWARWPIDCSNANGSPALEPIPILRDIYDRAQRLLWHAVPSPDDKTRYRRGFSSSA